jgi:predicted transcriptional regulator
MDALTEQLDSSFTGGPPVLIGASSEAALRRARATVEAAGGRIGDAVPLSHARERIDRQIAASAIWIELDLDPGADLDCILECINRKVAERRVGAVISSRAELIDLVAARTDPEIELVIDGDDAERAAALALATARSRIAGTVSDIASDRNAERLRQLSDEVGRIAATLARLSSNPPVTAPPSAEASKGDVAPVSAETVRAVIRARRLRSRYFPEHLFADPAWDMMLDLLQAEIAQLRVPVSSLCIAAAVPATTALRWLKTLVQEGLFIRRADPHDGRRVFVELAPQTSESLRRYFAEVAAAAAI